VTVDGLGEIEPIIVTTMFAIDGVEVLSLDGVTPLDASTYISWSLAEGAMSIEASLPDLSGTNAGEYGSGDMVSIFIMWKVPISGWMGEVGEVGFPEYQLPADE
jgi:hypothetical protein